MPLNTIESRAIGKHFALEYAEGEAMNAPCLTKLRAITQKTRKFLDKFEAILQPEGHYNIVCTPKAETGRNPWMESLDLGNGGKFKMASPSWWTMGEKAVIEHALDDFAECARKWGIESLEITFT